MSNRGEDTRGFLQKNAKKIVVLFIGTLVIVAGVAMLVFPGPGILTIVAGLAILASEFEWAERWMDKVKDKAEYAAKRAGVPLKAVVAVGIFFAVVAAIASWIWLN